MIIHSVHIFWWMVTCTISGEASAIFIFAYLLVGLSFQKKNLLISELRESTCKEKKNNLTLRTDGWTDDRRFQVPFYSILVISGRWKVDNKKLCNGIPFTVESISPRAGIELGPLDLKASA